MITIGRHCGSASWINLDIFEYMTSCYVFKENFLSSVSIRLKHIDAVSNSHICVFNCI